jgi:hypothetical protein
MYNAYSAPGSTSRNATAQRARGPFENDPQEYGTSDHDQDISGPAERSTDDQSGWRTSIYHEFASSLPSEHIVNLMINSDRYVQRVLERGPSSFEVVAREILRVCAMSREGRKTALSALAKVRGQLDGSQRAALERYLRHLTRRIFEAYWHPVSISLPPRKKAS